MKKSLVALMLEATMTAGLLAGCGSGGGDAQTETDTQETAEDGDYPVIKMAYTVMFPSTSEESIENALNEILREKAHAEVDLVGIDLPYY